jgi:hypothetical protein
LTFTDSISELTDQTVALFSILEVNNHVPEFESQNTYDIIGFPDFIYLESPVSIPVVQFQAFDNDKNDEIHYSISSQDFTIDEFTGQVYYNSEQYLSEEISAVIQVQHLSYDPANLDFIIKSSFPVFSK